MGSYTYTTPFGTSTLTSATTRVGGVNDAASSETVISDQTTVVGSMTYRDVSVSVDFDWKFTSGGKYHFNDLFPVDMNFLRQLIGEAFIVNLGNSMVLFEYFDIYIKGQRLVPTANPSPFIASGVQYHVEYQETVYNLDLIFDSNEYFLTKGTNGINFLTIDDVIFTPKAKLLAESDPAKAFGHWYGSGPLIEAMSFEDWFRNDTDHHRVLVGLEYKIRAGAELFTPAADTVDFRNLTAAQRKLVDDGANFWQALSGNDVVYLPNKTSWIVTANHYVYTDATKRFDGGTGVDKITGGDLNDRINGSDGNDIIAGAPGNDSIIGGAHNDVLMGAAGKDSLFGGDGIDTIDGGSENDTISGGPGKDVIKGGAGNDAIDGGTNQSALLGDIAQFGSKSSTSSTLKIDAAVSFANSEVAKVTTRFTVGGNQFVVGRISETENNIVITGPDGSDTLANVEKGEFNRVEMPLVQWRFVVERAEDGRGVVTLYENGTIAKTAAGLRCTAASIGEGVAPDAEATKQTGYDFAWDDVTPIVKGTYEAVYRLNRNNDPTPTVGESCIELLNVKGRDNIQIHVGNFTWNSSGCFVAGNTAGEAFISKMRSIINTKLYDLSGETETLPSSLAGNTIYVPLPVDMIVEVRDRTAITQAKIALDTAELVVNPLKVGGAGQHLTLKLLHSPGGDGVSKDIKVYFDILKNGRSIVDHSAVSTDNANSIDLGAGVGTKIVRKFGTGGVAFQTQGFEATIKEGTTSVDIPLKAIAAAAAGTIQFKISGYAIRNDEGTKFNAARAYRDDYFDNDRTGAGLLLDPGQMTKTLVVKSAPPSPAAAGLELFAGSEDNLAGNAGARASDFWTI